MDGRRDIHALRQSLAALEPVGLIGPESRFSLGADGPDRALGGGLMRGALHEVLGAAGADAASAAGFVAGLSLRAGLRINEDLRSEGGAMRLRKTLWVRQVAGEVETGKLYPQGLLDIGLLPETLIQVRLKDAAAVLRAGIEGARCEALGAVVIEPWGNPKVLDLTATRRLTLAAEESGVPIFLLRLCARAEPSAATTRWQVGALASRPLEANAPGMPAFDITLLRQRAGTAGLNWQMEWNRDEQRFEEQAISRAVAPLSSDRPAGASGAAGWRQAG
jgi:protein ImuA